MMDDNARESVPGQTDEPRRAWPLRYLIKILLGLAGGVLILVGILLLVLPGPGWALIFSGLGLLAIEFVWARRILREAQNHVESGVEWFKNGPIDSSDQDGNDNPEP